MTKCMTIMAVLLLLLALSACMPLSSGRSGVGPQAFVTNEKDNNLMVVDLMNREVVQTIATGKTPHALVFTPAGKGYVNNRGEGSLTVIDADSRRVIKTIKLPAVSMQFAMSPDKKTLAVGYKNALKITLIDTASDRIKSSTDIGVDRPGKKPVRIKHPFWSADGRYVYAGDNLNNTVVKIDAATGKIAAVIAVHASTHHFATAPDGTIYACHGKLEDGSLGVSVLDPNSDRVIKTIAIPMAPGEKAKGHHGAFSPDGRFFYFANEGGRTLAIIDTASLSVIKTLQVGQGAGHTYFSPDGKRAFVVCHHDNVVVVIDTASQTVIGEVQVGEGKKQGHSGYFGSDGDFYMLNAADGMLCRIDAASLRLTAQVKMGAKPMIMVVR